MGALYQIQYLGIAGEGHGSMVMANGKILGVDILGGRYVGTYSEEDDQVVGQAMISFAAGGLLVTGQVVQKGGAVPLSFSMPTDLKGGRPTTVTVNRSPVQVTFLKVGEF